MSNKIKLVTRTPHERKRRRKEFIFAGLGLLLLILLISVSLSYVGGNSGIFFALLNINIILFLLVLFLVVRNAIKLVLERRRGVIGSRLKAKLVITFMLLSLLPTIVMFIAGIRSVQTSVDYWFRNRIESYIQIALSVGTDYMDGLSARLRRNGEILQEKINAQPVESKNIPHILRVRQKEEQIALLGILLPGDKTEYWQASGASNSAWQEAKDRLIWDEGNKDNSFKSILQPGEDGDYAFGVTEINLAGVKAYIVAGFRFDKGAMYKIDRLARGGSEYSELIELKRPFKTTFYFFLALIAMVITLAAMWFGFRLSKELTTPLLALMEGTDRIARGDLSVRFDDSGTDEMGRLIQSFNRMTQDLEQGDSRLRRVNKDLSIINEQLAERNDYIEAILNSVAAGVISLDQNERISTINNAACQIFNLPREEFIGKHPAEMLRGRQAEFVAALLSQIRKQPGIKQQRQMNITLGEREWKLLITGTSLVAQDGSFKGIVTVFEDITELEKAQRMAAWQEVARRIAHEIKNPLTPIKLSAQRLERKFGQTAGDPSFSQCTELIVRQVEQLQQMVEEFSAFAKLPEVSLSRGSILPILDELITFMRNSHSSISWILETENALPDIYLDGAAIYRAFLNIATNAVEALQNTKNAQITIKAFYNPHQRAVQIDFKDNGPGIANEDLPRLFEPYFSNKRTGTGLGLAIVKTIINDHQGYVRAQNSTTGAMISVELPIA